LAKRQQFGVIFDEFSTAHAGLRYTSASGNNSDVRFRLHDPDFLSKSGNFGDTRMLWTIFWPPFHCTCAILP